ncbi:MAG: hypothetical protein EOM26_12905 [Alphaproteobacteria bacterium]|nr:hypothetical protein [Alphaproteobacteria bacterium]
MYSRKDSPGSAELGRYVLNHLDHLPHEADRARKALSVLKCADERSELAREAEGTIVGSVSSLPATDDVLQVFTHFRDVSALSGRMEAMLFERLKDEDSVPDRFYSAAHILALSSDDPERASRALKIMRDDIVLLSEEVVAEIVEFGTSNETGMPPWGEEVVGQIEALQVAVANSAKEPAEEDIPTDPARLSPGRSGALQPSTLDC